jgi:predicted RNA-binding protein with PUA-like domain
MARAKSHWLVKSDPDTYGWDELVRDGERAGTACAIRRRATTCRRCARATSRLFYHSGDDKEVVGVAKVVKAAYPDPTTDDARWVVVDLAPVAPLRSPCRSRT